MIWLFEKDSGRFFQSLDPVLPQKSEVNEAFWADHKITGDMVSKALEVCRETYCGDGNEEPLDAEEWSGAAPEDRFVLGGHPYMMSALRGEAGRGVSPKDVQGYSYDQRLEYVDIDFNVPHTPIVGLGQ